MQKPVSWKWWFLPLFLFAALVLAAGCGPGTAPTKQPSDAELDTPKTEPAPVREPASGQTTAHIPVPKTPQKPTAQPPANATDPDQPVEHPAQRPETAEILVTVEGMSETVTGTLVRSANLKYSFYLLPMFQWTAEEPGKNLISFKNDDRFHVRIEVVAPDADMDLIKKSVEQELAALGKIEKMNAVAIPDMFTKQAAVALSAASAEARKTIVVTDIQRTVFRLTMTLPHTEAVEGVEPRFWAMLQTLQPEAH